MRVTFFSEHIDKATQASIRTSEQNRKQDDETNAPEGDVER